VTTTTDAEHINSSLSDDDDGVNQILPLDDLVVQVSDHLDTTSIPSLTSLPSPPLPSPP
jgi:hypothetical protein